MATKFIKVLITNGTPSNCTYNIYYDTINTNNIAPIFNGYNVPTTPAIDITYSQLLPQPTGIDFVVVVPGTTSQIILYDNCNRCPPVIQACP